MGPLGQGHFPVGFSVRAAVKMTVNPQMADIAPTLS
jgi:hypothetical protein